MRMVALLVVVGCGSKDPKPMPAPEKHEVIDVTSRDAAVAVDPRLARGEYIANVSGCLVCHTGLAANGAPDFEHLGAGGLEMPDPMGTWKTPNITPDKSSGVGSWTDEQLITVIREGTRPDGSQLYSIMPYALYNRMTDDDVQALVAYLHTLKPVDHVVPQNTKLKFPQLNVPKAANVPDPKDEVGHGEYLASLMLCAHCHQTPPADAPEKLFTGGLEMEIPALGTGKLFAPNITSDKETGIGGWSPAQIFTTLKTMVKPDGKHIAPPMAMLQGAWSKMTEADLKAVAAYVHQIPAQKHANTPSTFAMKGP
ncbi:MAG: c-type cytochrome [Kofleriaceae bacterium]